jgi:hypothetical protein
MSDTLPTVRIKHPDGYAIINESDFDAAVHEIYEDQTHGLQTKAEAEAEAASGPVTVAKGPRGLWFVHKNGERQPGGFATEADALASVGA